MGIKAVIFDLDGVIVSTDEYHYKAWKEISDEEGIYFDRKINERLRGVSRMKSLEIILEKAKKKYTNEEKKALTDRKNNIYKKLLNELTPNDILPGVMNILKILRGANIKIAIGSSSKNTMYILEKIGLKDYFDTIVDGTQITKSKPNPEVFLLGAKKLDINPKECLVIEDADAGIEAALAGSMKALAVGYAANSNKADIRMEGLEKLEFILSVFN